MRSSDNMAAVPFGAEFLDLFCMPHHARGTIVACPYPGAINWNMLSIYYGHQELALCARNMTAAPPLSVWLMSCDFQSSGKADSERAAHAMADPEIQMILTDPMVRQVLTDFKENPQHAQKV